MSRLRLALPQHAHESAGIRSWGLAVVPIGIEDNDTAVFSRL
ncbi:hypothetical protein [Nocardia abscessus]|nr:hypothetical protein [Nocardia abscessus]